MNSAPANGRTRPETVAERHGYPASAPLLPRAPVKPPKWRAWVLGAVLGLLVGGVAVGALAYQLMPVPATQVQRVFADVNGDGTADLIVSAWVIFAPKAPGP